jgi:hypothetical protein
MFYTDETLTTYLNEVWSNPVPTECSGCITTEHKLTAKYLAQLGFGDKFGLRWERLAMVSNLDLRNIGITSLAWLELPLLKILKISGTAIATLDLHTQAHLEQLVADNMRQLNRVIGLPPMLKDISFDNAPRDLVLPGPEISGICVSMEYHVGKVWLPWVVKVSLRGFEGTNMPQEDLMQVFRCAPEIRTLHLEGAAQHVISAANATIGWKAGVTVFTDSSAAPPRHSARLLALKPPSSS